MDWKRQGVDGFFVKKDKVFYAGRKKKKKEPNAKFSEL
jgi:hypothetical protein